MPIHISRREFITGAIGAAGILSLPEAWADSANRDRFALFSDTHIAASKDELRIDVNMAQHLQKAVAEVVGLKDKPAAAFVNGDCAYLMGQMGDYATFIELNKPIIESGIPMHMSLGNHDDRSNFWQSVKSGGAKPLQNKHVSVVESEKANWFILDSLDKTNVTPGLLGSEQIQWLKKALDAHSKKPAIVLSHHQPQLLTSVPVGGLMDTQALLDVLTPRKQVKALIFGHTHHWEIREKEGIHLVNLPPVAYVFQKGDPSGWVDVHLKSDSATLELRSLDTAHSAHGKKHELTWRKT
jgi:Icc protein